MDLGSLSDHFGKNHCSTSEDEDKPQELPRKRRKKQKNHKKSGADYADVPNLESKSLEQKRKRYNTDIVS